VEAVTAFIADEMSKAQPRRFYKRRADVVFAVYISTKDRQGERE
jgi:hypothetical protein